ncbi:hypothetical protein VCR15J5_600016 [Vibrio crassostreae]|nr:hypothetical protein VCR15J5_600016 [Vibrio crassostreae]
MAFSGFISVYPELRIPLRSARQELGRL